MGGRKNRRNTSTCTHESIHPSSSFTSTLKKYCGCCNKMFSKDHGKTRKFVHNYGNDAKETYVHVNLPTTVEIWQGVEEIFLWRYGKRFAGRVDKTLALCPSCGFIVAKLFSVIKLFEEAKTEMGYLSKFAYSILKTECKGTDTVMDEAPATPTVSHVDVEDSRNEDQAVFTLDFEGGDNDILANFCEEKVSSKIIKDNSDKAFLCHLCSAGFNKQTNLTRHLLLSHEVGDREKQFHCSVCGKEFYFSYLLKNHEKIHGELRPYVCHFTDCTAAFKCKLGLHAHVKYHHHEIRPYKCRFCTKDFKEHRILRNHENFLHMLPHGMQPWVCEFCEMRYRRKSILRSHQVKCPQNPNRVKENENEIDAAIRSLEVGMEVTVETNSEQDQKDIYLDVKSDSHFTILH